MLRTVTVWLTIVIGCVLPSMFTKLSAYQLFLKRKHACTSCVKTRNSVSIIYGQLYIALHGVIIGVFCFMICMNFVVLHCVSFCLPIKFAVVLNAC